MLNHEPMRRLYSQGPFVISVIGGKSQAAAATDTALLALIQVAVAASHPHRLVSLPALHLDCSLQKN